MLHEETFGRLKKAFTEAPILAHYDPITRYVGRNWLIGFRGAGVLSQISFSQKMNPAERNYMI